MRRRPPSSATRSAQGGDLVPVVLSAVPLQAFAEQILRAVGAPAAAAATVATSLVEANLLGLDSHGVIRLPQYAAAVADGSVDPRAEPVVEREGGGVAVIDGRRTFGQVVADLAVDRALAMLGAGQRVAAVVAHDGYHVGRLGAYVERLAAAGRVGLAAVNNHGARPWTAPFGGRARRLATNPVAFAAPRAGGPPLLVDVTTSATAEGKVRVARSRGQLLPEGWLVDGEGKPSRDPEDLYRDPPGALLPLGSPSLGHKGFGLGLMVEVLAGALSGAGCTRPDAPWAGNGLFLLALDPAGFGGGARGELGAQVAALVAWCKDSPLAEGFAEILVPGEPERCTRQRRLAEGIPVEEQTWAAIVETARRLGVPWQG